MNEQNEELSWAAFRESLTAGLPFLFRIHSNPQSDIFAEATSARVGIRIVVSEPQQLAFDDLVGLEAQVARVGGQYVLELSTREQAIYQEFFAFALSVIDRMRLENLSPYAALNEALSGWRELVREFGSLSQERELGLWGELWLFDRLIHRLGAETVDAWTGPVGEPHDFRVGQFEFEVKTTSAVSRSHIVNGLSQLVPSPDRQLFLMSIQLEPAGAQSGTTLPEHLAAARTKFAAAGGDLTRLDALVLSAGYAENSTSRYRRRLQLRTLPRAIPVDDAMPRLTTPLLGRLLPPQHMARIDDVHYRVNVEGLGFEDGTPDFLALLPA